MAGAVIHRPKVLFAAAHKPNVGLPILRRFTLLFDPTGQRDWLIPLGRDPVTCADAQSVGASASHTAGASAASGGAD